MIDTLAPTDLSRLKATLLGEGAPPLATPMPVSVESCVDVLRRSNEAFRPYLEPYGHTVESYLNFADGCMNREVLTALMLAFILNRTHPRSTPDTMSDRRTVDSLHACIETVLSDGVPGDLIETGVWKGGMSVLMRGVLQAHGVTDRRVWLADSFAGNPQPDPRVALNDALWYFLMEPIERLSVGREQVEETFRKYGLLDSQVHFLPGWFADTLPSAPIERLAVLRLDGDWYDSTREALEALYPRLSPGGFAVIDDYGAPVGCRRAVDEYRAEHGIDEPLEWVNHQVVFWRKR